MVEEGNFVIFKGKSIEAMKDYDPGDQSTEKIGKFSDDDVNAAVIATATATATATDTVAVTVATAIDVAHSASTE